MGWKAAYKTYACGCVDRDEQPSLAEDRHEAAAGKCYRCEYIEPRPEVGRTVEFVRFGPPPASGRSWNGRDNFAEAGVSAYAILTEGRRKRVLRSPGYVWFSDRPAYRGVGVVVGYGSDDEILVEIGSIRRLRPAELAKLEAR